MPLDSARGRGYANCNCGAVLQYPRGARVRSGALRTVLAIGFLGLATAVVALARHLH
jgi:hypothetical protein